MAFVEWMDQFSVGVDELDDQHRRLLEIINHLHEAMKSGNDRQRLCEVVDELVHYTRLHFEFEEKMMEQVGYPELAEHRRRHDAMVARVEQFRGDVADARASFGLKLMDFLKYWLTKHILGTDKGYAVYLAAREARRKLEAQRVA